MTDWEDFNEKLTTRLENLPQPGPIHTNEIFQTRVSDLTQAIQHTIEEVVPLTRPSPHMRRWWSRELESSRREVHKLSRIADRYRALDDHESRANLEAAMKKYADEILKAKAEHWKAFLEEAMEKELWVANKYISDPTGDGGKTRIPTMKTTGEDGSVTELVTNEEKSRLFARALFPAPPRISTVPPDYAYPEPLPTSGAITEEQIRRNIAKLSPYKACGKGVKYTHMFRRLTRPSTGLSPDFMERLYVAVAIPKFAYAADIWYTPIHRKPGRSRNSGSVGPTRQLAKVQRPAVLAITGAMRSSPTDALELHARLLPVDLQLRKICHRAAMRIAALPAAHPLHKRIRWCAGHDVRRHRSPLHNLASLYHLNPDDIETINPVRQLPTYQRPFSTHIAETRQDSLDEDVANDAHIRVYTDGSGYKGQAGAAAVLYKGNARPKTLHYHLGPLTRNTTFEAEAVGVALGLHLLTKAILPRKSTVALDNQGVIQSTHIYRQRQSHYHFDAIHAQARQLAQKEQARPAFSLATTWISGHSGADGNEAVDKAAKEAAEGLSSRRKDLPSYLRKGLPASISALKQAHNARLKTEWQRRWNRSPRYRKYDIFQDSFPFLGFHHVTKGFTRRQYSLTIQLRTGHAPLNRHLHRLQVVGDPFCPHCRQEETVRHLIHDCRHYGDARHDRFTAIGRDSHSTEALFGTRKGIIALLQYIADTGRLTQIFGDVSPFNLTDNNDDPPQADDEDTQDFDLDWGDAGDPGAAPQ
ncbi:hypothetical protein D9615_008696 [Tricholomella constricta]|uniref:RNase H type-1 domain-containing protein n=1 Tax=Tricholomella constricta TaxID=117010 RepID=A0A8H5M2K1_9AGAR|nr:hypothetical protein D9615_008696 [Tricholomella constricta]